MELDAGDTNVSYVDSLILSADNAYQFHGSIMDGCVLQNTLPVDPNVSCWNDFHRDMGQSVVSGSEVVSIVEGAPDFLATKNNKSLQVCEGGEVLMNVAAPIASNAKKIVDDEVCNFTIF